MRSMCFAKNPTLLSTIHRVKDLVASPSATMIEIADQTSIFDTVLHQTADIIGGNISYFNDIYGAIKKVGQGAYRSNASLTYISFPQCSLIEHEAFGDCVSLSYISAPKTSMISYGACSNCYNLETFTFDAANYISAYAFYKCSKLTNLDFNNIARIGSSAFEYCTGLSEITAITSSSSSYSYCYIDRFAFGNCSNLTKISFSGTYRMNSSVFYACKNLSDIYIEKFPDLPEDAFDGLRNLNKCDIGGIETVGSFAFYYCLKLPSVSLSLCTRIFKEAFAYCSAIQELVLPKCYDISSYAMEHCSILSKIVLGLSRVVNLYSSNTFNYTPIVDSTYLGYYGSIYVPASLVDSYKSDSVWSFFTDRITALEGM